MSKKPIRITEQDIRNMVVESIRMITETENGGGATDDASQVIEFEIPMLDEDALIHFKNKLMQLKKTALSIGGDIDIKISTVKGTVKREAWDSTMGVSKGVYREEDLAHFTIIPYTPIIKKSGYKYIGSIVPMVVNFDGKSEETMIVSLSNEFKGNDELRNELQKSSMRMTCDGCHRETSRGIYFCFMEENTGKVLKFGSKCAAKYFGIDVSQKVHALFSGLMSLGNEPYVIYDPDGFPMDKIREPRLSSLAKTQGESKNAEMDNMILRGCMAIAEYGPYCNMKTSMTHAKTIEDLLKNASSSCYDYKGNFDRTLYQMKVEHLRKNYPELFTLRTEAIKLANEFSSEGAKFFFNMTPKSEFDEKIKGIGLLICGGLIQKKQIGKFSYLNFIPYCVSKFFKDKADKDPQNADKVTKPIEPFNGMKTFNVTVSNIDTKQTRYGKNFYKVFAITDNKEEVTWNIFRGEPPFTKGDNIEISASYNYQYKSLDNVKIVSEVQKNDKNGQENEINYPADGTRYKKEGFIIQKLEPTYLVVKCERDGCEYYISNVSQAFGYYGVTREKFDLTQLSVGEKVTIDGTVASYISQRTGKRGYKLLRVAGLPKSDD